jgi:hypothetical protein
MKRKTLPEKEQPAATPPEPEAIQPMVAEAAYYLAERRGFCPGGELEDWLAAEAQLRDSLKDA